MTKKLGVCMVCNQPKAGYTAEEIAVGCRR